MAIASGSELPLELPLRGTAEASRNVENRNGALDSYFDLVETASQGGEDRGTPR